MCDNRLNRGSQIECWSCFQKNKFTSDCSVRLSKLGIYRRSIRRDNRLKSDRRWQLPRDFWHEHRRLCAQLLLDLRSRPISQTFHLCQGGGSRRFHNVYLDRQLYESGPSRPSSPCSGDWSVLCRSRGSS